MLKILLLIALITTLATAHYAHRQWGHRQWRPQRPGRHCRSVANVRVNTLQKQRIERFKETITIKPDGTITDTIEVNSFVNEKVVNFFMNEIF